MANWPEFRPRRLLERLTGHGVDFVVVGGYAAIAHGSAQLTNDLDITYSTDPANLEALGKALIGLDARLREVDEEVPFVPDADTLRQVSLLTLDTAEGPLDLLAEPDAGPDYATLRKRAERLELEGVAVLVASLEDLISMKGAAGRDKDRLAVEELETIGRLRVEMRRRERRRKKS